MSAKVEVELGTFSSSTKPRQTVITQTLHQHKHVANSCTFGKSKLAIVASLPPSQAGKRISENHHKTPRMFNSDLYNP